ncbi:MAG: hypothetical protein SP1CHLAM54_01010 [Chlamydiia bacterium]|nr:hypothetical protein [Chlamydiia bacterium]MCH9615023.1 hypothetical protein [Chlamydiia bacterium]MCH9629926.1 hypothetical protein [Chlamydiia bacterium]
MDTRGAQPIQLVAPPTPRAPSVASTGTASEWETDSEYSTDSELGTTGKVSLIAYTFMVLMPLLMALFTAGQGMKELLDKDYE